MRDRFDERVIEMVSFSRIWVYLLVLEAIRLYKRFIIMAIDPKGMRTRAPKIQNDDESHLQFTVVQLLLTTFRYDVIYVFLANRLRTEMNKSLPPELHHPRSMFSILLYRVFRPISTFELLRFRLYALLFLMIFFTFRVKLRQNDKNQTIRGRKMLSFLLRLPFFHVFCSFLKFRDGWVPLWDFFVSRFVPEILVYR